MNGNTYFGKRNETGPTVNTDTVGTALPEREDERNMENGLRWAAPYEGKTEE